MGLAIGHSQSAIAHGAHGRQGRPANFGSLVSAINRGDLDAAQNAFTALNAPGAKTPGPLRKGGLEAMETALGSADLDAAKKALKEIQQGMLATVTEPAITELPVPAISEEPLPAIGEQPLPDISEVPVTATEDGTIVNILI